MISTPLTYPCHCFCLKLLNRSAGARDRFPRVLYLVGEFPKARKAFSEWASSVPEWAFLRWVSQMLGVAGRQEGPVVIQARQRGCMRLVRGYVWFCIQ